MKRAAGDAHGLAKCQSGPRITATGSAVAADCCL